MEQDRDWHYLCPIFGTNSVPCKDALGALSCCKGCLHNALAAHSNRFCALESSRLGYPACPGAASCYGPQLFPNTAWFGSRARFASELQHLLQSTVLPRLLAGCGKSPGSEPGAPARSPLPSWTPGEKRFRGAGRVEVNTAW